MICLERIFAVYRLVISVEEHSIYGGLGSGVAEVLAEYGGMKEKPLLFRIGVNDTFGESGTAEELLRKHGLDARGISARAEKVFREETQ